MPIDEDDKPTVVLDLAALKKMKLKQEEDLANIASDLEFNIEVKKKKSGETAVKNRSAIKIDINAMEEELEFEIPLRQQQTELSVILFDFQSKFFASNQNYFPKGHHYVVARSLEELNTHLRSKKFHLVVFNYDVNPKAVNQLSAQVKKKFPKTYAIIMARAISAEKAKLHAKTRYGASGYYQYPLDPKKIEKEFLRVTDKKKAAA
jgi:hypothetical protein